MEGPRAEHQLTPTYPWTRVGGLVLAAALLGVATESAATHLGYHFPSYGSFVGSVVWKLGMLALLVAGVRRWEDGRVDASTLGYAKTDVDTRGRTGRALLGLAGCAVLGAALSAVGASAGSGSSYGTVHKAGFALVLVELLIRYPLTVFAEEAFFRGWLQPRLPAWGPVASGLLFACFHLQQWRTIPSLIPLAIALGIIRWWTGDVRATSVLHYASNAAFFLSTYA